MFSNSLLYFSHMLARRRHRSYLYAQKLVVGAALGLEALAARFVLFILL